MGVDIPPKFVDIRTASSMRPNSDINIIGVVSDVLPARKSGGTDWTCTFSLADHSFGFFGEMGQEGLKVRFFKKLENDLPQIWGTGDVVVLRNMKIKSFAGMTLVMSSYGSTWTVIHASSVPSAIPAKLANLPHDKETRAPDLTLGEMRYVIEVGNHFDKHSYSSTNAPVATPAAQAPITRREKFSLVKDIQIDTFYDLVGQVVKMFPSSDKIDLYISDYTSNQLLYYYQWGQDEDGMDAREGDEYGYISRISRNSKHWPGPFGKLTLPVTLWSPHAEYAQGHVKEGDFVFLRNTHIRLDKDTKIVGSLHLDKRYPDRIDISVLTHYQDDDRVKDVLRRKKDYHKKFDQQSEKFVSEARATNRTEAKEEDQPDTKDGGTKTNGIKPLSKAQKKKKKKLERLKRNAQKTEPSKPNSTTKRKRFSDSENETPSDASSPPLKASKHSPLKGPKSSSLLNPNIRCSHHLQPLTPLSTILSPPYLTNTTPSGTTYTLPFQNVLLRTTACIIDFSPPHLEDFAVPKKRASEYAILSDFSSDSDSDIPPTTQPTTTTASSTEAKEWEWRFALTLSPPQNEPQGQTLKAYVAGADAEGLLKLDACDLRANPAALAALKEKLFLLWGNLEERKGREGEGVLKERADGNGTIVSREGGVRGKGFYCCLKEYGVKVRAMNGEGEEEDKGAMWRWERRWRLWGCTIV